MRLLAGLVASFLVSLALAGNASAFFAVNHVRVEGDAENIEVFARAGRQTGTDMFCAAADFADRQLQARATDRLVVTRTLSPSPTEPGRKSMSFRLSVADPVPERNGRGVVVTAKRSLGQTRAVGHAVTFCWKFGSNSND